MLVDKRVYLGLHWSSDLHLNGKLDLVFEPGVGYTSLKSCFYWGRHVTVSSIPNYVSRQEISQQENSKMDINFQENHIFRVLLPY